MSDERVRLFVALRLPQEVRDLLISWRGGVDVAASDLRPVPPQALHVTLCFLGSRAADEVESIARACGLLSGSAPVPLAVDEPVWLPPRRPRVLAVRLADGTGALSQAQARLERSLVAGGWYEPEPRPFLAHVTVARAVRGARLRNVDLPAVPELTFVGRRITLFRSRMSRSGARYEALSTVELG